MKLRGATATGTSIVQAQHSSRVRDHDRHAWTKLQSNIMVMPRTGCDVHRQVSWLDGELIDGNSGAV